MTIMMDNLDDLRAKCGARWDPNRRTGRSVRTVLAAMHSFLERRNVRVVSSTRATAGYLYELAVRVASAVLHENDFSCGNYKLKAFGRTLHFDVAGDPAKFAGLHRDDLFFDHTCTEHAAEAWLRFPGRINPFPDAGFLPERFVTSHLGGIYYQEEPGSPPTPLMFPEPLEVPQ